MIRICWLCVLLVAAACAGSPPAQDAKSVAAQGAGSTAQRPSAAPATDTTAALGEFEPLTRADVELYVKVMRAAADRVKNLPAADRQALEAQKTFATKASSGQMPSAEEFAAMERATQLMALDGTIAREMGVGKRYRSIRSRVPEYAMPEIEASGDDEPMTPEQRAALKARIEKFRERRRLDAATLAPCKDEILALQKQVYYIGRPGPIPQ
jgi:hypothetical protein